MDFYATVVYLGFPTPNLWLKLPPVSKLPLTTTVVLLTISGSLYRWLLKLWYSYDTFFSIKGKYWEILDFVDGKTRFFLNSSIITFKEWTEKTRTNIFCQKSSGCAHSIYHTTNIVGKFRNFRESIFWCGNGLIDRTICISIVHSMSIKYFPTSINFTSSPMTLRRFESRRSQFLKIPIVLKQGFSIDSSHQNVAILKCLAWPINWCLTNVMSGPWVS